MGRKHTHTHRATVKMRIRQKLGNNGVSVLKKVCLLIGVAYALNGTAKTMGSYCVLFQSGIMWSAGREGSAQGKNCKKLKNNKVYVVCDMSYPLSQQVVSYKKTRYVGFMSGAQVPISKKRLREFVWIEETPTGLIDLRVAQGKLNYTVSGIYACNTVK